MGASVGVEELTARWLLRAFTGQRSSLREVRMREPPFSFVYDWFPHNTCMKQRIVFGKGSLYLIMWLAYTTVINSTHMHIAYMAQMTKSSPICGMFTYFLAFLSISLVQSGLNQDCRSTTPSGSPHPSEHSWNVISLKCAWLLGASECDCANYNRQDSATHMRILWLEIVMLW